MHDEHVLELNTPSLERDAVTVLERRGLSCTPRPSQGLTVRSEMPPDQRTYHLEIRGRMTGLLAGTIPIHAHLPTLVVAPHVPGPADDVLRRRGLDYVDLAGNMLLRWDRLLIDVTGRRAPPEARQLPPPSYGRAFTRAGVRVTFCLLSWPSLAARPVRDIAGAAGVSIGTVHGVLSDLTDGHYLVDSPSGRVLTRAGELLSRWTEAHTLALSPTLTLGLYRAEDPLWWKGARTALVEAGIRVGGEAAGSELDPHLRPSTVSLYAPELPIRVLAAQRVRRADTLDEANVIVRRTFWTDPELDDATDVEGLVPAPLVYADLLASGDPRQRRHAERLRESNDRLVRLDRS